MQDGLVFAEQDLGGGTEDARDLHHRPRVVVDDLDPGI
jgi:hypothetical protein